MMVLIVYDEKEGWNWSVTHKGKTKMGNEKTLMKCFEVIDPLGILHMEVIVQDNIRLKGEDYD